MAESNDDLRAFMKTHGGLAAALLAAALLIIVSAWPAYLLHRDVSNEASQAAEYYSENAKDQIARECDPPSQASSDCAQKIDDAARENQRKEYDLAAQEHMAIWTAVMGWMAALGVAFSAIVAYLVWTTFRETKRSSDIAESAQRAWVTLRMEPQLTTPHQGGIYYRVNFVAENVGKTVARSFVVRSKAYCRQKGETDAALAERLKSQPGEWAEQHNIEMARSLIPGDTEVAASWNGMLPPDLYIEELVKGVKSVHLVFLAAVFYRTETQPDLLQVGCRAWQLCYCDDDHTISFLPLDKRRGPATLRAEPIFIGMVHGQMLRSPNKE